MINSIDDTVKINSQIIGKCGKSLYNCSMFDGVSNPCGRCTFDSPDLPEPLTDYKSLFDTAFLCWVDYMTPR